MLSQCTSLNRLNCLHHCIRLSKDEDRSEMEKKLKNLITELDKSLLMYIYMVNAMTFFLFSGIFFFYSL